MHGMTRRQVLAGATAVLASSAVRAGAWDLVNCCDRAVFLSKGQTIEPADLGIV